MSFRWSLVGDGRSAAWSVLLSQPVLRPCDEFHCHFNYAAVHWVIQLCSLSWLQRSAVTEDQHQGTRRVLTVIVTERLSHIITTASF